eukprot:TRINITY_DN733_c0_g1_i2.p1 TRINITY_DN733_c0_g1~~TRINITY_DN733_c0_g1_i2.p1  ORF type:complete len:355 (-),score=116.99 TRINITY_DN733_c0_g1_i2:174-1238(-)
MVQDPACKTIVHWTESGLTFIVTKPPLLAKQVLPRYFKHSNFSSFIRQLNMYGFHKYGEPNEWIFGHEHFQRDQPHLLQLIKRKSSKPKASTDDSSDAKSVINKLESEKAKLVDELNRLQNSQGAMQDRLQAVTQLNQSLWKELCGCQETQRLMKSNIERIIAFLRTVYTQRAQRRIAAETTAEDEDGSPTKRRRVGDADAASENSGMRDILDVLRRAEAVAGHTASTADTNPSAAGDSVPSMPSSETPALAVTATTAASTASTALPQSDAVPSSTDAAVPSTVPSAVPDTDHGVPDMMHPNNMTVGEVMRQVKHFSEKLANQEETIPEAFVDDFFAEQLVNGNDDDVFVPSLN